MLASVAIGEDGEYYNVNADEMASACAAACRAEMLVFLTDVAGVLDVSGGVIPLLHGEEIPALVSGSVISGGMLPKLRACSDALRQGVGRVRILAASQAELLPRLHLIEDAVGTEVIRGDFHPTDAMKEGVRFEYSTAK